jgi:hypothetical protein
MPPIPWRIRIVAITIPVSNLSIRPMDHDFTIASLCDIARRINSAALRIVYRGYP